MKKQLQNPPANDGNVEESGAISLQQIALRLGNIEALLMQLLERRKAHGRAGVRRASSLRQRVRDELIASGHKPSERHMEMARRFLASRR